MKKFAVLVMLCIFPGWLWAGDKAAKPMLVLDAGGHTDSVPMVLFTPDGKELISISKDKTIRTWSVATGELIRTLRPPIGTGRRGTLYAGALSPDGRTLAVGGIGAEPEEFPVILIDYDTGRIKSVLKGHTATIVDIEISPDGKWMASAGEDRTIRVWNLQTSRSEQVLVGHTGAIYDLAFAPDSKRLVSAAFDGSARIWSLATGKTEAVLKDPYKGRYYWVNSCAWSPDGKTIATGSWDQCLRLWETDGTLRKRYGPVGEVVRSVQFSPDSREVLITRGYDRSKDCSLLNVATGEERVIFRRHAGGVWEGALSPRGDLAATAGFLGEDLWLWRTADGSPVHRLGGGSRVTWSAAWSLDGKSIAWGNTGKRAYDNASQPLERSFRLDRLEFGETPTDNYRRAQETTGDLFLKRVPGQDAVAVREGERAVSILQLRNDPPTCFTFVGANRVAIGSFFGVHLFDARSGKQLRAFLGHTGDVWAVSPSPDNRYLVSAAADQTVRIWTLDRDEPLLSLFVAGEEWIAWTPEGYYAASPGGEKLMGWHVNNGLDKFATFHPAAQFRNSLYRPDLIKRLLEAGSLEIALELADKASGKKSQLTDVAEVLPPFILITSPDKAKIDVTEPTVDIRFVAKPVGKHPITAVRLIVNGRPYPGADGLKKFATPRTDEVRDSWTVRLSPGVNTIAVQAESAVSKALSEPVEVTLSKARGAVREPDEKEKKLELPNLYVLAIGVSEYPQEAMKLKYAAKDATVLAKTLQATSHSLYRNVVVKVLTDKDATRSNILKGLTWLRKEMTQRDVAIVSFAGHGSQDADGKLYLLPVDVDKDDLVSSAVPGDQVKSILAGVPGRVIVLLDACHSGAVDGDKRRAAGSLTDDLVRDLVTDDYGVIVMCSSMGKEFSLESATVEHGFFTLALVEGLSGKADYNQSGVVYLNGLDLYVTTRVKELSKGKQHPVTTRPTSIRSFPLSRPEKQSSSRAPEQNVPRVLASVQEDRPRFCFAIFPKDVQHATLS